ncbi:MAG: hypothetical protein IH840_04865 [Candidatus Heimdallarchaeota archaeon]|nr:hypothetical protein [Candidatus Heimdallarchaeota archaeon]
MKQTRLIYAVIFYLVYLTIIGGSTEITHAAPDYSTTTTMTMAPEAEIGALVNVVTSTTWAGSVPFLGSVNYFLLDQPYVHGEDLGLQTLDLIDPSLKFTLPQTLDTFLIQLPLVTILSTSSISWDITGDQDQILYTGIIHYSEFQEMIEQSALMISIGSHQSFTDGLAFQFTVAKEYRLNLKGEFTLSASDFYNPDLIVSSSGVEASISTRIKFLSGTYLGTNTIDGGGQTSISFTMQNPISYLLVYYGDGTGTFWNSLQFRQILGYQVDSAKIDTADISIARGLDAVFVANVKDEQTSLPLAGLSVKFYLKEFTSFSLMGTKVTDVNGIASFSQTIIMVTGNYSWLAEVTYNGKVNSSQSLLTVTDPTASLISLDAKGKFGSAPNNQTIVDISGTLTSDGGTALPDEVVEIYHEEQLLGNITTDQTGKIWYVDIVTENVGTYPD